MKWSMQLVLLTPAFVFTILSIHANQVDYYGPLIQDVRDQYGSHRVTIVPIKNPQPLEDLVMCRELTEMLSDQGIMTLVINSEQFQNESRLHFDNGATLSVILIDSFDDLRGLESFAQHVDMGYATWLILFSRDANRNVCQFCNNPQGNPLKLKFTSRVIISCCNTKIIQEWWSNDDTYVMRRSVGRLSDNHRGIDWFANVFFKGRKLYLAGQKLRATILKSNDSLGKSTEDTTFLEEALKQLMQSMNCTISSKQWENEYGIWDSKASRWTGLMGRVNRNETDIGLGNFIMTAERSSAVDFTASIMLGSHRLYFKKFDAAYLTSEAYYRVERRVFGIDVWIGIVITIITIPILSTAINTSNNQSHFFVRLLDEYSNTWGVFCNQGFSESAKELPSRIIQLTLLLSALLIATAYSATMFGSIATASVYAPFTNVKEFLEDGTYKLIVVKNSGYLDMFENSSVTRMQKMMNLMKPRDALPKTNREAFEQVCNEKVVLYVHVTAWKMLSHSVQCQVNSLEMDASKPLAFIVPRGSQYREILNYYILRSRSSGVLQYLERTKFPMAKEWERESHPAVVLHQIFPLIYMLVIGLSLSIIFFAIEQCWWIIVKFYKKRQTVKKIKRITVLPAIYPYCD